MPELSVFLPTIEGRDDLLKQVQKAIVAEHPEAQVVILPGDASWGTKLNRAAELADGAYWFCCCDDTVPLPGWFEAGRAMLDAGAMPASRYLKPDGSPIRSGWDDAPHGERVDWCRSFLLTPEIYQAVGPFIDATWYADIDYSERLVKAGWPILACDGYSFTHLDGERDWQTAEVTAREHEAYLESHRRQGIHTA